MGVLGRGLPLPDRSSTLVDERQRERDAPRRQPKREALAAARTRLGFSEYLESSHRCRPDGYPSWGFSRKGLSGLLLLLLCHFRMRRTR